MTYFGARVLGRPGELGAPLEVCHAKSQFGLATQMGVPAAARRGRVDVRWVSRSSRAHLKYGANDSHTLAFGMRRSRRAFDGGDKAEPCTANTTHATLLRS